VTRVTRDDQWKNDNPIRAPIENADGRFPDANA
jgi:hypothetical protein